MVVLIVEAQVEANIELDIATILPPKVQKLFC